MCLNACLFVCLFVCLLVLIYLQTVTVWCADRRMLVRQLWSRKIILNDVMNKKSIFWFHSYLNKDYIEPLQKEFQKTKHLSHLGMTVYNLGKNIQVIDTLLLKDTEKYWLSYRAHKNISQEEKVNDAYYSSLFVFDHLFM